MPFAFSWRFLLGCLMAAVSQAGTAAPANDANPRWPPPSQASSIFTNGLIPHLRIEISPEGMNTLRRYRWRWGGNREERASVLAEERGRREPADLELAAVGVRGIGEEIEHAADCACG